MKKIAIISCSGVASTFVALHAQYAIDENIELVNINSIDELPKDFQIRPKQGIDLAELKMVVSRPGFLTDRELHLSRKKAKNKEWQRRIKTMVAKKR